MQLLLNGISAIVGIIGCILNLRATLQARGGVSENVSYECNSLSIATLINSFKIRHCIASGILVAFVLLTTFIFLAEEAEVFNIAPRFSVGFYQTIGAGSLLVIIFGQTIVANKSYRKSSLISINNLNLKESIFLNPIYYYAFNLIIYFVGVYWIKNGLMYLMCSSIMSCIVFEILYCYYMLTHLRVQYYHKVESITIRIDDMMNHSYTNVKDYQIKNGKCKVVISSEEFNQVIIIPKERIVSIEKNLILNKNDNAINDSGK